MTKLRWLAIATITFHAVTPSMAAARSNRAYDLDNISASRTTQLSAARGNARAQTRLGFMYENGRGVPQNYVLAAEWYSRAAEQGDPVAQYLLGLMYDKGRGVPQDDVLAHMWLTLATARAKPHDRENFARIRDAIASKMTLAQVAYSQWLAYDWQVRRGLR